MAYNPFLHHRRSIRLPDYDYSKPGCYVVTICTHEKQRFFGEITEGKMILSEIGKYATDCWLEIPLHYPDTQLHEFVIMPDHLHGIIEILPTENVDLALESTHQRNAYQKIIPRSLGCIVRGYKIGVTKKVRKGLNDRIVWQDNFHDKIIRNANMLRNFKRYIVNNPINWKG